jgi:hypothetical protein
MIPRTRSFGSDDLGQAVVLIALAMATLLLGVGLAIDTGTIFVARRHAQSAADAAAWAGAVILYRGGTASAATTAAQSDATENGYTNGASSTTVSIVTPPTSGEWAGDTRFIEVGITRNVRTIFLPGSVEGGLTAVSAKAIAGAAPTGIGLAILTLGTGVSLDVGGGATLNVSGADVQVNSSANPAARTVGGSIAAISSPNTVKVVGETSGSGFTPTPETGATAAFDPFLAMPEPSSSATPIVNKRVNATETLAPGVYDGGIDITASGNATFGPGVYIIRNGGLKIAGGSTVTGSGVMIFNTVRDHPLSTGACGDIAISGGATVTLSAPTSGTYKGMLVWQDKDCTLTVSLTGTSEITALSGTFYAPTAQVQISGATGANVSINSQIISSQLDISGNATINLNYDANLTAKPLVPSLVE